MQFLYIKAIHIIFIVSWFAALFYIVRLFIYATEAQSRDAIAKPILTDQLLLMAKKTMVHHRLAGHDRHIYFWLVAVFSQYRILYFTALDVA